MVTVGRDGADLGDHFTSDRLRHFLDLSNRTLDRFIDAALQSHRVRTRRDGFHALAENGLRQHSRRGRAVARDVAGLRRYLAHHLGAHILHGVLEFNLFRHGHAVFRDGRAAIFLIEHNVAPLRPQSNLHCVGEFVYTTQNCGAGFFTMNYLLCHNLSSPNSTLLRKL